MAIIKTIANLYFVDMFIFYQKLIYDNIYSIMSGFLLFLLTPVIAIGAAWFIFHRLWRGSWFLNSLNFVLFEAKFPKSAEAIDNLATMEHFYDSLGKIKTNFVFEIAKLHHDDKIRFYFAFPKKFHVRVKRQFLGFFPQADLEPAENFHVAKNGAAVACSSLRLKYDRVPFHTYKKTNAGAVDAITKAMSFLTEKEAAVFQVVVKPAKPGLFDVNIRIYSSADSEKRADDNLLEIESAFAQFENYDTNSFYSFRPKNDWFKRFTRIFRLRLFDKKAMMRVTTEELTSVFHWPIVNMKAVKTGALKIRALPPPAITPRAGVILGKNSFRGETTVAKLAHVDRRRHLFIAGKSDTEKEKFLKNLIRQDIYGGAGLGVIDSRGNLIEDIVNLIPEWRRKDLVLFNPLRPANLAKIDIKEIVNNGKIFLVDFSKLSNDKIEAAALENVLINEFYKTATERAENRGRLAYQDFFLYVGNVNRLNIFRILKIIDQSKSYGHNINLVLSSDSIAQFPDTARKAVLENSGSLITFCLHPDDARILSEQFRPTLQESDFCGIDANYAHARILIDGIPTAPFSIEINGDKN